MNVSPMIVEPMPTVGPVLINREAVRAHFGNSKIGQHGAEFRMWRDGPDGFKVTISAEDALWIIDDLKLGASVSDIFRRAVVWAI